MIAERWMFSNLGLTLSLFRIADGISLEDLADAAGVSKGELSRYLKGKATPTFDTLATLLHLLDVEYPAFFYALRLVDLAAGSKPRELMRMVARLEPERTESLGLDRKMFPEVLRQLLTLYGIALKQSLKLASSAAEPEAGSAA